MLNVYVNAFFDFIQNFVLSDWFVLFATASVVSACTWGFLK